VVYCTFRLIELAPGDTLHGGNTPLHFHLHGISNKDLFNATASPDLILQGPNTQSRLHFAKITNSLAHVHQSRLLSAIPAPKYSTLHARRFIGTRTDFTSFLQHEGLALALTGPTHLHFLFHDGGHDCALAAPTMLQDEVATLASRKHDTPWHSFLLIFYSVLGLPYPLQLFSIIGFGNCN